jgi:LmbE family N-acetylglucosaminyl deacetylase
MIDALARSGPTLILAAHPDDEVLGAGGWMARYHNTCHLIILSEGSSANGDPLGSPGQQRRVQAKLRALNMIAARFGARLVSYGQHPVLQLHKADIDLAAYLDEQVRALQPTIILTHCPTDLNQDHRVTAELALVAARGFGAGKSVRAVLGFTVDPLNAPHLTPQGPNYFLKLAEHHLADKLAACAQYETEMRPWPHPRSPQALEHLLRWSGARIGHPAAEPYTFLWGCA